jgi:hypothetical protein
MKAINVIFEDNEHKKLTKFKGEQSWHDFIMDLANRGTPKK